MNRPVRKLAAQAPVQEGSRRPTRRTDKAATRRALALGVIEQHLGYFVRRLQVWIFQDFMRGLSSLEIRPAQFSVLAVIEANPGLSQSDIAELLGIERARLVRMLDRLERRGLTERRAVPTDRRSHALYLTREGHRVLKQIKELAAAHEVRLIQKLGPEKHRLLLGMLREVAR
jgi:DNA-binding MarR family transcriptional regulator